MTAISETLAQRRLMTPWKRVVPKRQPWGPQRSRDRDDCDAGLQTAYLPGDAIVLTPTAFADDQVSRQQGWHVIRGFIKNAGD